MDAKTIATTLKGTRSGNGWTARCPAHDDRAPSLSISENREGRVLVKCHAGCPQAAVIDALKSLGLWPGRPSSSVIKFTPRKPDVTPLNSTSKTDAARALWARAQPVAGTVAERYLNSRALYGPFPPDPYKDLNAMFLAQASAGGAA